MRTIGGGTIIEAAERRLKRNRPDLVEDLRVRAEAVQDERRFVEYCIRRAESHAASAAEIATRAKTPHDRLRDMLAELACQKKAIVLDSGLYLHRETAAELGKNVVNLVNDCHRQSPESPGIAVETLRQQSQLAKPILDAVVALLRAEGRLVEKNQRLASPQHQAAVGGEDAEHLERIEGIFREQAFHPPSPQEVTAKTGLAADRVAKILRILREHQRLVQIEDLLFHGEAVARARQILIDHIRKEGKLESVNFKYLLDTTRKYALPLLDHLDRTGVTRRSGNTRFLKNPQAS